MNTLTGAEVASEYERERGKPMIAILKRQFIMDATGGSIGVILPLEEFTLIADVLEQRSQWLTEVEKLELMEQTVNDPLFMADLNETMYAFAATDDSGWEPNQ